MISYDMLCQCCLNFKEGLFISKTLGTIEKATSRLQDGDRKLKLADDKMSDLEQELVKAQVICWYINGPFVCTFIFTFVFTPFLYPRNFFSLLSHLLFLFISFSFYLLIFFFPRPSLFILKLLFFSFLFSQIFPSTID